MWTFEAVLRNCFLWKILLSSYKLYKILIITLGSHDLTCFSDMKAQEYFDKIQNPLSPCLFQMPPMRWALYISIGWKGILWLNFEPQRARQPRPAWWEEWQVESTRNNGSLFIGPQGRFSHSASTKNYLCAPCLCVHAFVHGCCAGCSFETCSTHHSSPYYTVNWTPACWQWL